MFSRCFGWCQCASISVVVDECHGCNRSRELGQSKLSSLTVCYSKICARAWMNLIALEAGKGTWPAWIEDVCSWLQAMENAGDEELNEKCMTKWIGHTSHFVVQIVGSCKLAKHQSLRQLAHTLHRESRVDARRTMVRTHSFVVSDYDTMMILRCGDLRSGKGIGYLYDDYSIQYRWILQAENLMEIILELRLRRVDVPSAAAMNAAQPTGFVRAHNLDKIIAGAATPPAVPIDRDPVLMGNAIPCYDLHDEVNMMNLSLIHI